MQNVSKNKNNGESKKDGAPRVTDEKNGVKNENNVTGIERKREHDTHNCAENSRYFLQTKCGR